MIGAFTVASVAIGAGIVSIPYAMYHEGLGFSIFYYIFNYVIGIYAIYLLLKVKDATGLASYPEQAFYCFGKSSIIIVNVFVLIAFGILPIAYFNVFADLCAGLIGNWVYPELNVE
jgi:amino acid permease